MKRYISSILIALTLTLQVYAEDKESKEPEGVKFIPLFQYDYLSLDDQSINSTSAGLMINSEDVQFIGIYTNHSFNEDLLYDYPQVYHTIDTLLDGKKERHRYIGIFKSESDMPVTGGLSTYTAAAVYGYEIVQGDKFSFVLGGGLAAGDFGIERSNGEPWPVIPVPFVRMKYGSDMIETKFEFLTSPNFSFTLAPKSKIRFTGDFRMDQARDIRDLIFECALAYRFFSADHEMGDFAGVSIGVKNDNYGAFSIGDKDGEEALEAHYYAVFGALDLSLLKITGGYAFGGRELYREDETRDTGKGYFISVQALYQF